MKVRKTSGAEQELTIFYLKGKRLFSKKVVTILKMVKALLFREF